MPFDDRHGHGDGDDGGGGPHFTARDVSILLHFLRGAERHGDMYDTYTGEEAFDAACRIIGLDPQHTRDFLNNSNAG